MKHTLILNFDTNLSNTYVYMSYMFFKQKTVVKSEFQLHQVFGIKTNFVTFETLLNNKNQICGIKKNKLTYQFFS